MILHDDEYAFLAHRSTKKKRGFASENARANADWRKLLIKVQRGRGRKVAPWNIFLQKELCTEFELLFTMGMKFSFRLIAVLAKDLIPTLQLEDKLPVTNESGTVILELINMGWVQRFMERYNIVSRRQCGQLMISSAKQFFIKKQVAYDLGTVPHDFGNGPLDEDCVENIYETHFVVNAGIEKLWLYGRAGGVIC